MADAKDQDEHAGVFDFTDEAVGADAVFPELAEPGLADAARIVDRREAFVKEFQYALAALWVEPCKLAQWRWRIIQPAQACYFRSSSSATVCSSPF